MSELNELFENTGFDKMTSWIESYAKKLEFEGRKEILILSIDRLNLEIQSPNNIIEVESIKYGDWEKDE